MPTELEWERLACRMLHKVCPAKEAHAEMTEPHCTRCGLDLDAISRFIIGDVGKMVLSGN